MSYTPLEHCERILIDTSVIIHGLMTGSEDEEVKFILSFMEYLDKHKSKAGRVRKFLFSDITLSECVTLSSVEDFARTIAPIMRTSNAEIRPFDSKCAIWVNNNFKGMLSGQAQKAYARKVGFKEHQLKMAREWISKDMMIISTAVVNQADLILTMDSRTFKPLADRVGVGCVIVRPSSFQKDIFGAISWAFNPDHFEYFKSRPA